MRVADSEAVGLREEVVDCELDAEKESVRDASIDPVREGVAQHLLAADLAHGMLTDDVASVPKLDLVIGVCVSNRLQAN